MAVNVGKDIKELREIGNQSHIYEMHLPSVEYDVSLPTWAAVTTQMLNI